MNHDEMRAMEERCVQEHAPPCTASCPVHLDVRGMISLIAEGRIAKAMELYGRAVLFPEIVSRFCDRPCEFSCNRRERGGGLAVRWLERFTLETVRAEDPSLLRLPPPPPPRIQGKRISVIGSGLRGLAAAYSLVEKGYEVTVIDRAETPGGRLASMRPAVLPPDVLAAEIDRLQSAGVRFVCGRAVPPGSEQALLEENEAVIMSASPDGSRFVGHPGGRIETYETGNPGVFAVPTGGCGKGTEGVPENGSEGKPEGGQEAAEAVTPVSAVGPSAAPSPPSRAPWLPITEIAQGKGMALSVDRFLKKVSLSSGREREGGYASTLFTNLAGKEPIPRLISPDAPWESEERPAGSGSGYASSSAYSPPAGENPAGAGIPPRTRETAAAEADRCFRCSCLECVKGCVYLEHFESYPKRYIREIANNISIVFGIKTAKPLINSCSLCGLCRELCPTDVDMGPVCLSARRTMWEKGSMPPAIHDFPIRDMLFSNEPRALLSRHQRGRTESSHIFFPGCQLSGLAPWHVLSAYRYLCGALSGGVGIMLGCCGAPARWAGREEFFRETIAAFTKRWEEMGSCRIITACPSCKALLSESFPEGSVVSVWEEMASRGFGAPVPGIPDSVSVLDPCSSRYDPRTRAAVRTLLASRGVSVCELQHSAELTACCGYGGLVSYANPAVADKTVRRRLGESQHPYVAYCAMCREAFSGRGKPVYHLFDFFFEEVETEASFGGREAGGDGGCAREKALVKGPSLSARQDNRIALKRELLRRYWGEEMEETDDTGIRLLIADDIAERLEKRLILRADLAAAISRAEETGRKVIVPGGERWAAQHRPGIITYWVEYSREGDAFRVHNAYSHRLEIVEEKR